ncbi:MAG: hypothetical protein COX77_00925 [Candidatus Komeilibacteria bacterium CG_4_10_14_0_2_um_filter_37_10]|uniref:ABC transporter substrate-binding protein n=1 Tax=Candidatus Komeilibacteria bacterium CG_4_10_14_0_2_um_filter_37_10 TaxID=1974470 RepID=A0A2M7VG81_9BACT|nr:MAG: hypothetical protein COX77_00925 [Candidatus Komeilibacteria bacterium CG_4_10_14_0_2_um_filter_37_10]
MVSKVKIISLLLLVSTLPLFGFGCKTTQNAEVAAVYKPITLNWWGVWEDSADVAQLITAYRTVHPNITITYRKLRFEEYEKELTKAWLEKKGPDIFALPASYLKKYKNIIKPMPEVMKIPFVETTSGLNKKEVVTVQDVAGLTSKKVKELFIDAVSEQTVIDDKVYGLPLNFDNLALYYNSDLLAAAKIPLPARTWKELLEQIPSLAVFDKEGNIKQAAIALGTENNVPRATDIVSLLMMQNGARMTDERGQAVFNMPPDKDSDFNPAQSALQFYSSFINPSKDSYTWSEKMPDALEQFTAGKLAYFIGYSYQWPIIKSRSPKLNVNIAPMLQVATESDQEVNFADFWAQTVYFGIPEANIDPAWDFIKTVSTTSGVLKPYLEKVKRPTALRALINDQMKVEEVEVFVNQLLSSKSWYRGYRPEDAEQVMQDMIQQNNHSLTEEFTVEQLLQLIVSRLNKYLNSAE